MRSSSASRTSSAFTIDVPPPERGRGDDRCRSGVKCATPGGQSLRDCSRFGPNSRFPGVVSDQHLDVATEPANQIELAGSDAQEIESRLQQILESMRVSPPRDPESDTDEDTDAASPLPAASPAAGPAPVPPVPAAASD